MKLALNKGRDKIDIQIPDQKVRDVILGSDIPGIPHDRISRIIQDGIRNHSPRDIAGRQVAVIIPDDTRAWARGDRFVPDIIKTLFELGVPKEDITIIIALGTHADLDPAGFERLAGRFCAERVRIINSANKNRDRLTHMGKTALGTDLYFTKEAAECDHIIIFGGVLHHMAAGYGGGRKYILPGIAGYDSIQQNHSLTIQPNGKPHPAVRQGELENNPVNRDITEGARIFLKGKTCTCVAVAANGAGELFHAQAGDLDTTFTESCRKLDRACCVRVPQKGDFALISTGGHRTDTQLYQSTKALFNAVDIVKEGAPVLFVAGCSEGVGNDIFASVLADYKDRPETMGLMLARDFNMPAYVAFRVLDILHRFQVTLVSDLPQETARRLGFNHTDDIDGYISTLPGNGYIIPFAENILPVAADP